MNLVVGGREYSLDKYISELEAKDQMPLINAYCSICGAVIPPVPDAVRKHALWHAAQTRLIESYRIEPRY